MTAPKLAGILGWPVRQSLSPLLHGYWLKEHGIDGQYVALPVRREDLGRCLTALRDMGFAGVNVTVPHKEAAFALADELDDDARATGAVNVIRFAGGAILGGNTDVAGFAASLAGHTGSGTVRRGPAAVLGAGGAARAVLLALLREGYPSVRLVNRTRPKAEALARAFGPAVQVMAWGDWEQVFDGVDLIVNATSLGMNGKEPLTIPFDSAPVTALAADIVYNPLETAFLSAARARGLATLDGLGMLMHQAVPAFAAWFGVVPAVTPGLRAVLEKALRDG